MKDDKIVVLVQEIIKDRGIPRNIRNSLEESMNILNGKNSNQEKIAHIESILDDASNDHNMAAHTRTHIWNIMSMLEEMKNNMPHE